MSEGVSSDLVKKGTARREKKMFRMVRNLLHMSLNIMTCLGLLCRTVLLLSVLLIINKLI